uniref:Uncharacterized protein n=1 Tax=Arundo donax TaxID=35708 RepID=A0A0A9GSI9_ARUDO
MDRGYVPVLCYFCLN